MLEVLQNLSISNAVQECLFYQPDTHRGSKELISVSFLLTLTQDL